MRSPRFDPGPYRLSEAAWNDVCTRNRELLLQRLAIRKAAWSVERGPKGLTVRHGAECVVCGKAACEELIFEVRFVNNERGARLLVHARDAVEASEQARNLGAVTEVASQLTKHGGATK